MTDVRVAGISREVQHLQSKRLAVGIVVARLGKLGFLGGELPDNLVRIDVVGLGGSPPDRKTKRAKSSAGNAASSRNCSIRRAPPRPKNPSPFVPARKSAGTVPVPVAAGRNTRGAAERNPPFKMHTDESASAASRQPRGAGVRIVACLPALPVTAQPPTPVLTRASAGGSVPANSGSRCFSPRLGRVVPTGRGARPQPISNFRQIGTSSVGGPDA
jgi:hypothetical protein